VLFVSVALVLWAPWFNVQGPLLVLSNAALGGDRHVNALWDLPTTWIARRWVDPTGRDLAAADEAVRFWPRTILRGLFLVYFALEVRRLWTVVPSRYSARVRQIVEAATRIALVALLVVFNQVLAWYFAWPLTTAAALGWRSSVAKLAVAYSVLYLPLFYAIHEDLVRDTAPWLIGYAVAPLVWLYALHRAAARRAHAA
jgi:hypothetical protein